MVDSSFPILSLIMNHFPDIEHRSRARNLWLYHVASETLCFVTTSVIVVLAAKAFNSIAEFTPVSLSDPVAHRHLAVACIGFLTWTTHVCRCLLWRYFGKTAQLLKCWVIAFSVVNVSWAVIVLVLLPYGLSTRPFTDLDGILVLEVSVNLLLLGLILIIDIENPFRTCIISSHVIGTDPNGHLRFFR
jgi:hypothetical protein